MAVGTFIQPDFESMGGEPTEYKSAIEGSIAAMARIGDAFAPHEQDTPDMTVRIDAGALWVSAALLEVAAQNTSVITAPTTHPRIDRVVINATTGACYVVTGTEAASPTAPTIPSGYLPCCQIALTTATTAIDNTMLTDERLPVPGGSTGDIPINGVYSNLGTNPATELSYGTWKSLGYDSDDICLLHFDGIDTAFTDSGPLGLTITPTAYATQSTTQRKFGNRSLACLNAGDYVSFGAYLFDFGFKDFSIDFWLYCNSLAGNYAWYLDAGFYLRIGAAGQVLFYSPGLGAEVNFGTISATTWTHIALVRTGQYVRCAINGTFSATVATITAGTALASASALRIGGTGGSSIVGYIDEFRVSRIPRWYEDFSVATAQYETVSRWVRTA